MANQVPLVNYLVLGDDPCLVAQECTQCGPGTSEGVRLRLVPGTEFRPYPVPSEGTLRTFTIVGPAGAGIKVPFVSAIAGCAGMTARASIVNVRAEPEIREVWYDAAA
jgi:uncharacterized protein